MDRKFILNLLVEKWGASKTFKVFGIGVVGGLTTALAVEPYIPNEPITFKKKHK